MPLWLINLIVNVVTTFGTTDEDHQIGFVSYKLGKWIFLDNWETGNVHLSHGDKEIFHM